MFFRHPLLAGRSLRSTLLVTLCAAAAIASEGACSSSTTTSSSSGKTSSGGDGGSGGEGGASVSSSSSSTSGVGGGGGAGGMVDPGCLSDADCTLDPKKQTCQQETGDCVECLPANDTCAQGQYCEAINNTCVVGCNDQGDCNASTVCDPAAHICVGCTVDTNCPLGSICISNTCVPGCTGFQPCQIGYTCCNQSCFDIQTDAEHCGDCSTICEPPSHMSSLCIDSSCSSTCVAPYEDCNKDLKDGCERNTLADGACTCVPGDTQVCYFGPPGTLGIGECKTGVQTCAPDGLAWGNCVGQVMPASESCNGLDDDCDGTPEEPGCTNCIPGTGSCNGQVGTSCRDDALGYITETCDPALLNTTCNPATGKCDGECGYSALGSSYIGCDYYATVTANLVDTQFHFAIAVSNSSAANATVTVTRGAATVQTVQIAAKSVQVITLPWISELKGPASSSVVPFPASIRVNQGAYRVQSTKPVTVYQFNPLEYKLPGNLFSYSNDASILLPVNAWTGTYRAAREMVARGSGFYTVTARDDNTTVTVQPGPNSGQVKAGIPGIMSNGNGSVILNAGDVIEVVTNGSNDLNDPNDVTGTLVQANKPVQVIGGHQCIYIPFSVGYCDHIEESMFPYETLSNEYIVTAPLIPTGGQSAKVEVVRIVATKPNTTITYDPPQAGAPTSIAQAGQWFEIANTVADFQITSNEPILVVQYMEGQDAGGNSGDPSMSLAVGKAQYRDSYLIHAPTNYDFSYINIMAPTGTTVFLDGAPVAAFAPIGGTGYSVARTALSNSGNGNHELTSAKPFGISVYGYGQYTSYWYPGGLNLTLLHD